MKTLRKSLAAAAWMAVSGLCLCSPDPSQAADGGIWNDPEISTAVEKARNGQTEEIMRLTSRAKPKSQWRPVKKNLPQYHECLGPNENPLVQFFAVAAVSRFKDKSSVEPLQKFVMTAQRRVQGGTLPREEAVMLQLAVGAAVETLGEIDGDNDLSVAFLGTLLKHDIQKEWGGAVVHSALAKKGLPGLRRLLKESLTADADQINYICSALEEIRDPSLVGALYAVCLDTKHPYRARFSALSAIGKMRATAPQVEQLFVDILMNEKSDLRGVAAIGLGEFGTEHGRSLLLKLRDSPPKGNDELDMAIEKALLHCDTENAIDGIAKAIFLPSTSDEEKIRLCSSLIGLEENKLVRHVATLTTFLKVEGAAGAPLNAARVSIWRALYRSTGKEYPLVLLYNDDREFDSETSLIRFDINDRLARSSSYPYDQCEAMAMEKTKQSVTKWVKEVAHPGPCFLRDNDSRRSQ